MKIQRRRQHTMAFKAAAVQRSIDSPDTVDSVAKALGIHPGMLTRWRSQMARNPSSDSQPQIRNTGPERSIRELENENKRLKKRLARAELEAEILKKAKEYFGKNRK